jgi:hypothetical protein
MDDLGKGRSRCAQQLTVESTHNEPSRPEIDSGLSVGLVRVVSIHSSPFMTTLNTTLSAVSCPINETISFSSSAGYQRLGRIKAHPQLILAAKRH